MTDTISQNSGPESVQGGGLSPLSGVLTWVRVFFFTYIGAAFVLAVVAVAFAQMIATNNLEVPSLNTLTAIEGLASIVFLAAYVLSVIFYCIFVYRAVKNVHQLEPTAVETSPGWAVGSWFIPFVNLVWPFVVLRNTWRGSHGASDARREPPVFMAIWWFCWVVGNILVNVSSRMIESARSLEMINTALYINIAGLILTIASAWLAVKVAKGIMDAQSAQTAISSFD